jgi:hypothetical protein
VIVDGKEGKRYDNLGFLVFSQDSSRIVYAAQETKKWFVVIDGKEGKSTIALAT